MPDDEDPKHDDATPEEPKKDEPKANWGSRLGALGRGFQKAIKDASESETGKQLKGALAEVGPQMKKAAQAIGPELKKVVDQVRPDVERAVNQLRPEVDRIVSEAKPVIEGALNDLLGRDKSSAPPPGKSGKSATPPNISPDAAPGLDDDDEDEHTRPDAFATNPRDAGSNADDDAPPEPPPRAPSKTIGRKAPRKGGKGSAS